MRADDRADTLSRYFEPSLVSTRGEDTKRNLKHVKDRAANLAERPQRVSSVTRITSTLRACANARTFLRSARSCFAPEAISFQTPTTL
jgi:hypothetical protein